MRIEEDTKLDFEDVLIKPKRSTIESRKDVNLEREFTFKHSRRTWSGIPIVASNMDTVGTISFARELQKWKMLTILHKFVPYREIYEANLDSNHYSISTGFGFDPQSFGPLNCDFICADIANGYTEKFSSFIEILRDQFPDKTLIAGNVCTPEAVESLILSGADIVKVGIGGGSACLTRKQTAIGYPQLSCAIECADAAHGLKGHIISDGGCRTPADVVKALAAGSDFVMLGGMLAGHTENTDEIITRDDGKQYSYFYGMSSETAMKTHYGERADYRASEGRTTMIPFKGPVKNTLEEILGGLRSACAYVGARKLKELSKCCTFIKVNNQLNRSLEPYTVGN